MPIPPSYTNTPYTPQQSNVPPQPPQPQLYSHLSQQNMQPPGQQYEPAPIYEQEGGNHSFLIIGIFLVIIIGAAIGVGAYFLNDVINTPKQVKERVEVVQPVFDQYSKSIAELNDFLKNTNSKTDSDAFERMSQKASGLVSTAENDQKTLKPLLDRLDIDQVKDYKKYSQDYIDKSQEVINLAKDVNSLASSWVSPMKDYEALVVSLSGVSSLTYTDPDKYVATVNDALNKEDAIIKKLEKIEVNGNLKDYNDALVKTLSVEYQFLKDTKDAIEKRSSSSLGIAQQKYATDQQAAAKEVSRIGDKIDEQVSSLARDVDSLKDKVNNEVTKLRNVNKF